MKLKVQSTEFFNVYKEYMDELKQSLENFENSVSAVEQSLYSDRDDYEEIIYWAQCVEVRQQNFGIYTKFAVLSNLFAMFKG